MAKSGQESIFELYKRNYKRKQRMSFGMNVLMTVILIPLLKILDGADYSTFWRILSVVLSAGLFVQNIRQSRMLRRQAESLSEYELECVVGELDRCPVYRKSFYFTSEYLFSTEGIVLPYYEIKEAMTRSYVSTGVGFVTNIVFVTRSFGKCVVPVGIGHLSEEFYDTLEQKCPNAIISFRATYQKATREEYFDTIRADSINVIRKRKSVK